MHFQNNSVVRPRASRISTRFIRFVLFSFAAFHRELVLDAPFTLFLQKPFDPNQLAAAIAELRRGNDNTSDGR